MTDATNEIQGVAERLGIAGARDFPDPAGTGIDLRLPADGEETQPYLPRTGAGRPEWQHPAQQKLEAAERPNTQ